MKICAVTSAFISVRPDRPFEYFLGQLVDFLSVVGQDDDDLCVRICVEEGDVKAISAFVDSSRLVIQQPEELLRRVWPEPRWREIYFDLIQHNPTHHDSYQARHKRLIAVYLGKLAILSWAFEAGAEIAWWFDAGHWVSHQCDHRLDEYSENLMKGMNRHNIIDTVMAGARQWGILGTRSYEGKKRFHMPLEHMFDYLSELPEPLDAPIPLYQGVFWVIRRDLFSKFFQEFQVAWSRLISDGKAGTEESALTLLGWKRRIPCMYYMDWISALRRGELSTTVWGNEVQ